MLLILITKNNLRMFATIAIVLFYEIYKIKLLLHLYVSIYCTVHPAFFK